MVKFFTNEIVVLKDHKHDPDNMEACVVCIYDDGLIWVSNLNMPFCGSISCIMHPDKLEKRRALL